MGKKIQAQGHTTNATPSPPLAPDKSPPEPVNKNNNDTSNADEAAQQRSRIKVSVNLVNVLVSVLDENNRPAPDLPIEAFQLFEEGVRQKIEIFESETKQPLEIVLMIDASLSAHKEISFEQQAAAHFIAQVLRPADHLAVFAFDENVTQIAGFSDNVAALQNAVHRIPPAQALLFMTRSCWARGRWNAAAKIAAASSSWSPTAAKPPATPILRRAQSRGARQHVALQHHRSPGKKRKRPQHRRRTRHRNHHRHFRRRNFLPGSAQDLDIIFDRIDRELRTQYRLGYYPNPRGPANTYRSIEVKVLDNYKARHRKTY